MSGIVGGKNHRGSGLIADLGTDGQILTSAGAGVRQIFEAAAGGTGKSYYTRIQYDATASTATTAYTGFGFAPKSLVAFNGNYPIDEAYSLGFAEKTDGNGGGKETGNCWHANVHGDADDARSNDNTRFLVHSQDDGQSYANIAAWGTDGITITTTKVSSPTGTVIMDIQFYG